MKKLSLILALSILLAGGIAVVMSAPSYAQAHRYPPPPADPYATPWVGPNTPWIYYNGDWFLNGVLYYFFGPQYGWAPYYAYPLSYMVRPQDWYAPRWRAWYQGNPHYWQSFQRAYPYWRGHRASQRYEKNFYEKHHRGHGGGWQKGFHGTTFDRSRPEGRKPGPSHVTPSEGRKPGPTHVTPSEGRKPGPTHVTPSEGRKPGPTHVTPSEGRKPGPTHVTPSEGRKPGPTQVAPPKEQKRGPAGSGESAHKPEKAHPGDKKPAKTGPGAEKQ